jgi:TrkA domain protein
MPIKESTLPGVGKKFEVKLDDKKSLFIIIHHSGRREIYLSEDPETDNVKLFELNDRLAKEVGGIIEGALFNPTPVHDLQTMLTEKIFIEWYQVPENCKMVNKTIREMDLKKVYGVTIIAIQRGENTLVDFNADEMILVNDTLVTIGTREKHELMKELLTPMEKQDIIDEYSRKM